MTSGALLGFVVITSLAVMTPGLDTMLVLRSAVLGGRRRGLAAVAGISIGCLVWGTASVLGLTALLTASRLAYDVVRFLGAAYLLWLGGSALWKSLRRNSDAAPPESEVAAVASSWAALRAGLLTNLLNPKVGVFAMSLLPQFLPAGAPAWGALLVAMHIGIGIVWYSVLTSLAVRAKWLLTRAAVKRWLDRVTATVLIGFGIKLATDGT
ncbi:LysE family translocator [Nocardia mexicana]|uniref:Threonine/homoserine/homoserine lactone efflux protein n=1 Tax=Nocardia mexicana TaxID=279262 RepID=A0A370HFD8_9NOCA|nr:LysE family translocator [Nocardia mexicana]RDI55725.1 threonine/homoserine/homoserine lactone efflux protein [Nocardia mexicana]